MLSLTESNNKNNIIKIPSLKACKTKITALNKRAFFLSSVRSKGSMALEASMVLPVFLFFMMTVLLSLEAVRFQSDMQEALHQAGNRKAVEAYEIKYGNGKRVDTQSYIKEYLADQLYPYLCIEKGDQGISVQDQSSVEQNGQIELRVEYRLKPFIYWLPIGEIKIEDRFYSHSWTGYSGAEKEEPGIQESYVYVTKSGSRYHRSYQCTYLRVKAEAVDYEQITFLRNESGRKYSSCSRCKPTKGGIVYITSEGRSYHGKADCPSLRRTIYIIPLSEAGGYGACSKCAG